MTLITPDDGPSGLSTSIDALARQLADMRRELEVQYQRLKARDFSGLKDGAKATAEIRQWMKIAIEAEAQHEKRRKQEKGIVHGYALDFDAARDAICGRLDRLRRARDAG